jgi:hypothetical protein
MRQYLSRLPVRHSAVGTARRFASHENCFVSGARRLKVCVSSKTSLQFLEGSNMRIGTVVLFVFAAVFTIILPRVQALNTVDAVGTAGRILADQFASDTDALNAVIGNMSASSLSSNQIVALCTAWPQSAILDDLFAMAKQNDGHGLTHAAWWGLVYAKTPTVQIPENLESDLDYLLTENRHWHDVLNGAVLRRLHRDSEARRVVVE